MLASGTTYKETAKLVGCSEKAVYLWKKQAHFLAAVTQAENEIYQDALSLLKRTTKVAIITLVRNMGEKISPYVQVSAASKLLEQSMEVHTFQPANERLQALEEVARSIPHNE